MCCFRTYNSTLVEISEMPDGPQRRARVESLESMDMVWKLHEHGAPTTAAFQIKFP